MFWSGTLHRLLQVNNRRLLFLGHLRHPVYRSFRLAWSCSKSVPLLFQAFSRPTQKKIIVEFWNWCGCMQDLVLSVGNVKQTAAIAMQPTQVGDSHLWAISERRRYVHGWLPPMTTGERAVKAGGQSVLGVTVSNSAVKTAHLTSSNLHARRIVQGSVWNYNRRRISSSHPHRQETAAKTVGRRMQSHQFSCCSFFARVHTECLTGVLTARASGYDSCVTDLVTDVAPGPRWQVSLISSNITVQYLYPQK
jgi:hypothetical protein